MVNSNYILEEVHDRQAAAVSHAVAKLLRVLEPQGFTPEAIFEGAVKGGAIALLSATEATSAEVADMLEAVGDAFRQLDKPALRVVT